MRPRVADHPMTSQDSVLEDPGVAIRALQAIATPVDLKELVDLENDVVFAGAIHASMVVSNLALVLLLSFVFFFFN